MNRPLYSCCREGSGRRKEKIKLKGEAGEPLKGQPLRWQDEGSQIWHEYLYMMGALAPLREQWVALTTETLDTCFCLLQYRSPTLYNAAPELGVHCVTLLKNIEKH